MEEEKTAGGLQGDEAIRMKCLELAVECFSWFGENRDGIKGSPISLAEMMFDYVKGNGKEREAFYPQPISAVAVKKL